MSFFIEVLQEIFGGSGFAYLFTGDGWENAVMLLIAFFGTKERVVVEKTEKVKVIDSFKMVLKNKPCILMIFLTISITSLGSAP